MNDFVSWAALGTAIAACLGLAGFWYARGRDSGRSDAGAQAAKDKAESATNLAAACLAKLDLLNSKFEDHRVDDAQQFARVSALVDEANRTIIGAENRLVKSIEDMSTRFDRSVEDMGDRFDRFADRVEQWMSIKPRTRASKTD